MNDSLSEFKLVGVATAGANPLGGAPSTRWTRTRFVLPSTSTAERTRPCPAKDSAKIHAHASPPA